MELTLKKDIIINRSVSRAIGVTAFVILTSLGAFVRIPLPFSPVPLTLQTFFVLLGAAVLGKKQGVAAQLAYVLLGAAGLPIFSQAGSGLLYLAGPTAGYLLGFIAASFFIGQILPRVSNKFSMFLIFLTGDFLILGLGVFWLKLFLRCSFSQSLIMGLIPFIPGDLFKAAIAVAIYRKIKNRCREIF
jgi:biotin transport system substrate-specific component